MLIRLPILFSLFLTVFSVGQVTAAAVVVNSVNDFNAAQNTLSAGDTIIWADGTYANARLNVGSPGLTILAQTPGGVVFNGTSDLIIRGDGTFLSGFQYVGGNIGPAIIIRVRAASNVTITQVNVRDYTCDKYLVVEDDCQYVDILHCNFERRTNYANKNILSVLISPSQPGFHTIRYCSFKNFPGGGADEGVEPIRIGTGLSGSGFDSRSLVEYCYFTKCNGDGEIISSKGTQNVYRFNTFEDNEKSELVLRHGSEGVVYGNFFLRGMGGVRIKEGQGHYVYNNYFYQLDERSIILEDHPVDPLDDINIGFNTIVDCENMILNGTRNPESQPMNVELANNLMVNRNGDQLFRNATGTETWLGNIAMGTLGITAPAGGLSQETVLLDDDELFPGLAAGSPGIDAAVAGFKSIPQYEGMAPVDTAIHFDLLQRMRPEAVGLRDVGAVEFPSGSPIRPFATEENTGTSYNSSLLVPGLVNERFLEGDALNVNLNNTAAGVSTITMNADCETLTIAVTDPANAPLPPFNAYEFDLVDEAGEAVTDLTGRVRVTLRVWSAQTVEVSGLFRSGGGGSEERSDLKSQTVTGNSMEWTEVTFLYTEDELAGLDPTDIRDFWLFLDRGTENFSGNQFVIDDITFGGQRDPAFDSFCNSLSVPSAPRERFLPGEEDRINRGNGAGRVSTFVRDEACETLQISVTDPAGAPLPSFNAYSVNLIDDSGNTITDLSDGVRVTMRVWSAEDVELSGLFLPGDGNSENRTMRLGEVVPGGQADWTEVTLDFSEGALGTFNPTDADDFWFYLDRGMENFNGNNFIIDDITFTTDRDPAFNSPCSVSVVTSTATPAPAPRFQLYPTLTTGSLRWTGPTNGTYRIFDQLGRPVALGPLAATLEVQRLPSGTYWLLAAGGAYSFIRR